MSFPMQPHLHGRKRHPFNTKLRLWWDAYWNGLPVNTSFGPLITNYLEKTHRVMQQALNAHSRLLAVPVLLRYPSAMAPNQQLPHNKAISRFMSFLSWEFTLIDTAHAPDMHYLWCREQLKSEKPHYHAWLLFNGHALQHLGTLKAYANRSSYAFDSNCLYHRLVRAWAWAIGWPLEDMEGLVDITTNSITKEVCTFDVHRGDEAKIRELFFAMSYACKAYSKPIGEGVHCFDGSQL